MKSSACILLACLGVALTGPVNAQVITTNGQVIDLTALRLAASQSHHGRTNHLPFVPSNATNGWQTPVPCPAGATNIHKIKATASGASGQFGLHKVDFAANIAAEHPLKLVAPDGEKLWCRPTALGYYDTKTGQSVILGWIKASVGEIQSSNQVIFRNAFSDLRADVQYEYTANSLEQNVILRERPKAPEAYGLDPETTHLEIWTAWSKAKHLRTQHSRVTLRQQGNNVAKATADDTTLDFGAMKIARGKAFKLGADPQPLSVAKEWHQSGSGGFLLEIVDYKAIEDKLTTLPTFGVATPRTNGMSGFTDRKTLLAALDNVKAQPESKSSIRLAQAQPEDSSGVVLDFVIVAAVPLPQDAYAWWKADANALDLLGSNDGTLMNGATYAAGQVCDGFSVNGVASYVKIPYSATLDPGPQFTLEFWLKADANNAMNNYQGVVTSDFYGIEISNGYGGTMGLNFFLSTNAGVTWNMISTANGGGAPITAGVWHHVAGTYDGANMQLYVDGQAWGNPFACSGTISSMPGTGFLAMGSEAGRVTCGCSRYFNGIVDEVTLYHRALSPSEISGLYNAGGGGKSNPDCYANWSDAVAWWPGDGNANDLMGNSNGSLQGGATYSYGRVSRAFDLDGNGSYVEVPDNTAFNFGTADFSLEFWVNFRDLGDGNLYYPEAIFAAHDEGGGDQNKWIFGLNGRLLTLLVDDPIVGVQFLGQVPFEPDLDTWYHLAVVRAGETLNVYTNGLLAGTDTITADLLPAAAPLTIGQAEGIGFMNGLMDELTIYNRALSGTEIAATYSAGAAGKCKDDLNRNHIPDWWELKYFGSVEPAGSAHYHYENGEWVPDMSGDYDGGGISDLQEFLNSSDPNKVLFIIEATNAYVNVTNVYAQLRIQGGMPSYYAIFTNGCPTTNWLPFVTTNLSVNLGNVDGTYSVVVGLRGLPSDAQPTWENYPFTLDRVPPRLMVTNPVLAAVTGAVVDRPFIQIEGLADEPLSALSYVISNSLGITTKQNIFVTDQHFDSGKFDFTTNYFHAYDVPLETNLNHIVLHMTDRAGNVAQTNFNVILSYAGATNPVVKLTWPQDNLRVGGSSCTINGTMNDETGTIMAMAVNGVGETNFVPGLVERNGMFWIENVPLSGINQITIYATNAAGLGTNFTFTLKPSTLNLTVDTLPAGDDLYLSTGTVLGTVDDTTAVVTVNGITANVNPEADNGVYHWSLANAPIPNQGTATFEVSGVTPGGKASSEVPNRERALAVFVAEHHCSRAVVNYQRNSGATTTRLAGSDSRQKDYYTWYADSPPLALGLHFEAGKAIDDFGADAGPETYVWNDVDQMITRYWPSNVFFGFMTKPLGASSHITTVPDASCKDPSPGGGAYYVSHYWALGVHHHWYRTLPDNGYQDFNTSVTSRTKVVLLTGGKSSVQRTSLFCINAWAKEYGKPPYSDWGATPEWPINSTSLRAMNRWVGTDGKLWAALPDNSDPIDLTVAAPTRHYDAGSLANKETDAIITYESSVLGSAGQTISGVPGVPPGADAAHWNIIQANTGDADHDGVPDFADGFDMYGSELPANNPSPSASFTRLNWSLPSNVDPKKARVKFSYNASDPAGLTRTAAADGGFTYTPAPGALRLWGKDGSFIRHKARVNQVVQTVVQNGDTVLIKGDYLAPNVGPNDYYDATNVPTCLYLEGIRPSSAPFDQTVQILVDPDGRSGYISLDTIHATVVDVKLVEATGETTVGTCDAIQDSHPSPVFTEWNAQLLNVKPSLDGSRLVGTLHVNGNIRSAMCDLVPGEDGKIGKLRVSLNGEFVDLGGIATQVTKAAGGNSFTRPYAMEASFTADIDDVDVSTGVNWIRLEASDSVPGVGLTGFAEQTIQVTATLPTITIAANSYANPNASPVPAANAGSYFGWNYGVENQSTQQSTGGDIHTAYLQLVGPDAVLDALQKKYPDKIAKGPDGKCYQGNPQDSHPSPYVAMVGKAVRVWENSQSFEFKAGFADGFVTEGVGMVWGTASFVAVGIWEWDKTLVAAVTVDLGFNANWADNHMFKVNTAIDKAGDATKSVYNFVVAINSSEYQTLEAAARGDLADVYKKSEPLRVLGVFGLELIKEVGTEYANDSAFEQGKMQGRVCLQIDRVVIPATKFGALSKLGFLTNLREAALFKNDTRLLATLDQVIATFEDLPQLEAQATGEAPDKILTLASQKMANGIAKRQAFLQALVEVIPNAGDRHVAIRLQELADHYLAKLPDVPTAQDMDNLFTYADWKYLIQQKGIQLSADECAAVVPRAGLLRGHHVVEKDIINELMSGRPGFQFQNLDHTTSPVKILTQDEHFGPGDDSLHNKMFWQWNVNESGMSTLNPKRLGEFQNPTDMLNELIDFYVANYPDQAKATRGWCIKNNVPYTH